MLFIHLNKLKFEPKKNPNRTVLLSNRHTPVTSVTHLEHNIALVHIRQLTLSRAYDKNGSAPPREFLTCPLEGVSYHLLNSKLIIDPSTQMKVHTTIISVFVSTHIGCSSIISPIVTVFSAPT